MPVTLCRPCQLLQLRLFICAHQVASDVEVASERYLTRRTKLSGQEKASQRSRCGTGDRTRRRPLLGLLVQLGGQAQTATGRSRQSSSSSARSSVRNTSRAV